MEKIALPFSKILCSKKDKIAEIIINDGELLCLQKIAFLHEVLLNQFKSNFYLLINKRHSYCYTYKAQLNLADIQTIKAIAIVNYSKISLESSNYVMSFGKKTGLNTGIFTTEHLLCIGLKKLIVLHLY